MRGKSHGRCMQAMGDNGQLQQHARAEISLEMYVILNVGCLLDGVVQKVGRKVRESESVKEERKEK
jgi:hypothetical protein